MADTNPLRDELYDMLHLCLGVDDADDLAVDWCNDTTASVLDVLAEFIGDGLLDANGQRVKLVQLDLGHAYATRRNDGSVKYVYGDVVHESYFAPWQPAGYEVPLFVLERSETDQEGQ